MKLHLKYSNDIRLPLKAAFIRGKEPAGWLKEISRLGFFSDELECYILPESIQSIRPAGLFVIFKNIEKAKQVDVLEPYGCIEDKIYMPVHAELEPKISNDELKSILLWEKQIFHPVNGLIGLETKDQVQLADLFIYGESVESDWSYANPGLLQKPEFRQIQVISPSTEELIDSIKSEIGQKPLHEIPVKPGDEYTIIEKLLDNLKFIFLKGILSVSKVIEATQPASIANNNARPNKEGLFQHLQKWLERNLNELQEKRNNEIKRLLKLFDENDKEALQYAIPLNSPYLNRGNPSSTSNLKRRPLEFNLKNLGGGMAVDTWDIGNHYNDLRNKYLKAAQSEIEKNDFKKAAYVYAHLLGDYHGAANVLKQGNMYREAATLYKDHLKNIPSAAECLEKGGLHTEAIELYKELYMNEKVGDLYMNLDQKKNAEPYYEKHIANKLSSKDYLDAARVMNEKLKQTDRAKQTLLVGWNDTYQAETCLKNYFDIIIDKESENIESEITGLYARATPDHKKLSFLNILEYVNKKKTNEKLAATTQDIAYQIISREAEQGNMSSLHSLKRFVPADRLISSDASRYTASVRTKSEISRTKQVFYLDQSIKWMKAIWHRNQFLVIGIKNDFLQMARGNWYGNLEYYSWINPVKPHTRLTFINAPYYSNHILLHCSDGLPISRKNLPKNKYFNEAMVVNCPIWLHKETASCVINDEKHICRLDIVGEVLTLHHYTIDGDIKKSINCAFEKDKEPPKLSTSIFQIACHNEYYYSYSERLFITISEKGLARSFDLKSVIRFFAISNLFAALFIIISTNRGCLLNKPSEGDLNTKGSFFAENLIPTSITFISADRFVIIEKKAAFLFEIIDDHPRELKKIETHSLIISALPTSSRYQFALIEETGKITMCDV